MRILLSNDDGWRAPGLAALRAAVSQAYGNGGHEAGDSSADDVIAVAPDRNRSGASNSLTLTHPLRVYEEQPGLYSVDGTPTDCVHLAITGLFDSHPDMVVSGINAGANMGDDVLYSGTVAAATEGRSLGLPAIAVSLAGEKLKHYETAARVSVALIGRLQREPLPADTILNVNVPDRPWDQLSGFEVTRLGNRHPAQRVIKDRDPRGGRIYWIGLAGGEADAGPGTDFHAVACGKVSITPIQTDATCHSAIDEISGWIRGL